jgi:predicted small secreted protein
MQPIGRSDELHIYPHKEIEMKKLAAAIVLMTMAVLTGCNTVQGAGKDIERGGEKIQSGAKNVQEKM